MKTTNKRRPKGEGSIQRMPNGNLKMTITIGRTPDGRQRRKSLTAKTKAELLKKVAEARLSMGKPMGTTMTLRELLEAYLKAHESEMAYNTLTNWMQLMKTLEPLMNERIDKITPQMIDNHLDTIIPVWGKKKKYANSSLNIIRSKIAALYNFALERKMTTTSPTRQTKKRKVDVKANTLVIPEEAEMQRLLKEVKENKGELFYNLCLLAVSTGARLGELVDLRESDVNLKTNSIRISHQATKEGLMKRLKTQSSLRTIFVDPEVLKVVLKGKPEDTQRLFGDKSYANFATTLGTYFRGVSWLPKGFTFHCFRHYHATQLLAKGVDVKAVSKRLGHSNIQTTLNLYVHWIPEVDQKAARLMGSQFVV